AEMREALQRWERDLHEGADEVPTLVHLALSHYQFEDILEAVRRLPVDTKTSHLLEVLHGLQARGYRQVLVFTQFTDTLDFLREHLVAAGFSVLCFSGRGGERRDEGGRWRVVSRDEARRLFREGRADILLSTEAASEGLT